MNVLEVIDGDVIKNKYGNISLSGAIQRLEHGIDYVVEATFEDNKYGGGYKMKSISADKPKSLEETYAFLCAIMPERYADEIFKNYPNIIEMVENGEEPDLSLLHGIKEKAWAKIKRKIEENFKLADIVALFDGALSMAMVKKIYDKYENVELVKQLLKEKPYECICNVCGFGFVKADSLILSLAKKGKFDSDMITSEDRCIACMQYVLKRNEGDGNTLMLFKDFNDEVKSLVPEAYANMKNIFSDEKDSLNKKFEVFVIDDNVCISLFRTRKTEKKVAEMIKNLQLVDNKWNIEYDKYTSIDGFNPSDEQRSILKMVCENNIAILNGAGGTGKTTSTRLLVKMLVDNNLSFMLLAPTGKASKVLQSYTNHGSSTIHRALGYSNGEFIYNSENQLKTDIVIVDETSMIDIFLFKSLLEAINPHETKILLIGDAAQLPSVGCGNVFYDLLSSPSVPKVNLTKVFRYSDGGLMKVATDVRNRKKYLDNVNGKITIFGNNKDYAFIQSKKENIKIDVINIYKRLLGEYKADDIMVLSPYRKGDLGCNEINRWLQKLANRNAQNDNSRSISYGDTTYYVGDIVIQNQNNYNAMPCTVKEYDNEHGNRDRISDAHNGDTVLIANGETGVILMINEDDVIIDFNGQQILYSKSDMSEMSLGYALTIHKSQGDSSKIVILITASSHTFMLNSNIIYVGMTRMREKCYHIGDVKTVNRAVKIKANFDRKTSLKTLLV
ncbi:AAA family ATPase [Sharpea azabuensis]|uniref:AAA family ATPase n=1 Tax=Sharpea azabuensis TaxID=322505 RepID=UPI002E807F10|nr:AAA family ATPase [Sharpea azabuensis]